MDPLWPSDFIGICVPISHSNIFLSLNNPSFHLLSLIILFSVISHSLSANSPIYCLLTLSFVNKVLPSQSYGFSSSHVWMWELIYKKSWVLKNWSIWAAMLEKTLESPLDSKEILPVHPKGNQSWIFIGRTDGEVETPILWPPDVKKLTHWKRVWC